MALPVKVFKGKINGKNAYTYTSKLNYKLKNYAERSELVNKILENDDFFVEYFDKYFKVNLNQEDFLSFDNNICQSLEQIANYLLFSPDIKEKDKESEIKYIFYTNKDLNKKIEKDYDKRERIMMFLVDKNRNYRVEIKQKIFNSDFTDEDFNTEIKYYKDSKNNFYINTSNYLKNLNDMSKQCNEILKNNKKLNHKQKYILKKTIKEIKIDSIIIKDKIKGTIYFNNCLPESEDISWYLMNFTNQEQVLCLLKVYPRDLMSDLGILVYDLNQLLEQIQLNDFEKEIVKLWRTEDNTQEDIADELKVSQQFVSATLKGICKKIIKQYKKNYEDWLYFNYFGRRYKKCSKCGKEKLINNFGKDKRNKDGLKSYCKKCDNYTKTNCKKP